MIHYNSKLPISDITIFTVMSALANQHQAINLGQGFPDFDCDTSLKALVEKYLNDGKNQYCPMPGLLALRQSISHKMNRSYGMTLDPATQICITAGATQALFTAITAFIHDGDEVIIIEPAYDSYQPAIRIAGGIPKPYQLTYPDYSIDWNELGAMVNDVLSDEVYEHLIYDKEEHQSVLRFPNLFNQSLAVYSFGKTFHSTGWKIGYCVGPAYLMNEFKNIHQWNVFSVNSFTQYALAEHLKNPASYESLGDFFQQKRDYLTKELSSVPLKPKLSAGTYFQLFNYAALSKEADVAFAKYLTTEIGVAAIPLSPFYTTPPGDKVIRLCFAKKETTLAAAAERLSKL